MDLTIRNKNGLEVLFSGSSEKLSLICCSEIRSAIYDFKNACEKSEELISIPYSFFVIERDLVSHTEFVENVECLRVVMTSQIRDVLTTNTEIKEKVQDLVTNQENNFKNFTNFVQELQDKHRGSQSFVTVAKGGRKYFKVCVGSEENKADSVWCFVDRITGDIFKASSWSSPAKHSRGNINNPKTYETYSWTGPHYLR